MKELNIDMDPNIISTSDNIDNVTNCIDKFKIHPSILKIKHVVNIDKTFNFDFIDIKNMTKTMHSLDTTKSNPINTIPAKIIINNCDIFIPILHNNFNNNVINNCDIFIPILHNNFNNNVINNCDIFIPILHNNFNNNVINNCDIFMPILHNNFNNNVINNCDIFIPILHNNFNNNVINNCDIFMPILHNNFNNNVINNDIFIPILHNNFNSNIINGIFPFNLNLSDISPTHKKKARILNENDRPISILPAISKIYEKLMEEQLNIYFERKLSEFQCGFRKGFSAQHCLIYMIEKWKKSLDKRGSTGALLTDLNKTFDCLNHGLLIAKLDAIFQ